MIPDTPARTRFLKPHLLGLFGLYWRRLPAFMPLYGITILLILKAFSSSTRRINIELEYFQLLCRSSYQSCIHCYPSIGQAKLGSLYRNDNRIELFQIFSCLSPKKEGIFCSIVSYCSRCSKPSLLQLNKQVTTRKEIVKIYFVLSRYCRHFI